MLETIPLLIAAWFFGWLIGYTHGRTVKEDQIIATASEDKMLREVKRRRLRDRLEEEVGKQVESEAGSRPAVF